MSGPLEGPLSHSTGRLPRRQLQQTCRANKLSGFDLARVQNAINESVFEGLGGAQDKVALHVAIRLFKGLSGQVGEKFRELIPRTQKLFCVDLHVSGLTGDAL